MLDFLALDTFALDTLALAAASALLFTGGAYAISRAGRYARQVTSVLTPIALMLGLAALTGALARYGDRGRPVPVSRAEARPAYGMDWSRPPARVPVN